MSRSSKERSLEHDFTRFSGYGDRVGSGVEFAPTFWSGGELVTDPNLVNKSLKPRRMYYSPIGDGVVAADGVELKRLQPDLTPKVEVIHQRFVERGTPGRDGVRIVEKNWTTGGGADSTSGINRYGSDAGGGINIPDYGRDSRATTAPSPFTTMGDPLGLSTNPLGLGANPPTTTRPGTSDSGLNRPITTTSAPLSGLKSPSQDPYGTLGSIGSIRSEPAKHDYLNGAADTFPQSGRTSTTSALFSDPGMRYEMKKDYLVTNPKELIHQYATTTPVQTIDGYESLPGSGTITRTIKEQYSKSTTEETYAPAPPYHAGPNSVNPLKFVRQIRDEGLTPRQHQANQNKNPYVQSDVYSDKKIQEIRQQALRGPSSSDVDSLTDRLMTGLQTSHSSKY